MIWAGQQQFTTTVVANAGFYDGLSDEHREMVDSTIDEMVDVIFKIQDQYAKERLDKIKENSDIEMIHLDDSQRAVFAERPKQVEKKFVEMTGDSGQEVLNSLKQEISACEDKVSS
jgi:TRAP-type C4-dicarboxylate transport system substrate-binding protein